MGSRGAWTRLNISSQEDAKAFLFIPGRHSRSHTSLLRAFTIFIQYITLDDSICAESVNCWTQEKGRGQMMQNRDTSEWARLVMWAGTSLSNGWASIQSQGNDERLLTALVVHLDRVALFVSVSYRRAEYVSERKRTNVEFGITYGWESK